MPGPEIPRDQKTLIITASGTVNDEHRFAFADVRIFDSACSRLRDDAATAHPIPDSARVMPIAGIDKRSCSGGSRSKDTSEPDRHDESPLSLDLLHRHRTGPYKD